MTIKLTYFYDKNLAESFHLLHTIKALGFTEHPTASQVVAAESTRVPGLVQKLLRRINIQLGTHYESSHYYNWISGRIVVPGTVRRVMLRDVFRFLFGVEASERLRGLYEK